MFCTSTRLHFVIQILESRTVNSSLLTTLLTLWLNIQNTLKKGYGWILVQESVTYPGISTVTATTATTNILTIPLNLTGSGGTQGFYINLPIYFTGTMIGGIDDNQTYYVTTVVDSQRFTMSLNQNPLTL